MLLRFGGAFGKVCVAFALCTTSLIVIIVFTDVDIGRCIWYLWYAIEKVCFAFAVVCNITYKTVLVIIVFTDAEKGQCIWSFYQMLLILLIEPAQARLVTLVTFGKVSTISNN